MLPLRGSLSSDSQLQTVANSSVGALAFFFFFLPLFELILDVPTVQDFMYFPIDENIIVFLFFFTPPVKSFCWRSLTSTFPTSLRFEYVFGAALPQRHTGNRSSKLTFNFFCVCQYRILLLYSTVYSNITRLLFPSIDSKKRILRFFFFFFSFCVLG